MAFLSTAGSGRALASSPEAILQHQVGLAALQAKDQNRALAAFEAACLSDQGEAVACLAWAKLARERGDIAAIKQALASAVILEPNSLEARYELGMLLLERRDYTWAAEHLAAAFDLATSNQDKALLAYYLGYAQLRLGHRESAKSHLEQSRSGLPEPLQARVDYYLGVLAMDAGDMSSARILFGNAARIGAGPFASDANARLQSSSAFADPRGLLAKLSGSFGFDTHPLADFADDNSGDRAGGALKSLFRGDLSGTFGKSGLAGQAGLTVYRDQSYTDIGRDAEESGDPRAADFNLTLILAQAGLIARFDSARLEHRVRLWAEGEVQLFDHLPEDRTVLSDDDMPMPGFTPGDPGLGVWTLGLKLAYALSARPKVTNELRLLFQVRPNYVEEDRSTFRYGIAIHQQRSFLDRNLKAKLLLGFRYDRSFYDPAVIKYDRLLPELSLDVDWTTPVPRLSASVGAGLKLNWYLNSRGNAKNSFRPPYQNVADVTPEQNDEWEAEYTDMTRADFEWELRAEVAVALWRGAELALPYRHHQRASNLDRAPHGPNVGFVPTYGYNQDVVSLELRQTFF
jgi:Tfp pilus assembly protein PilF